jgi:hypothetical protein
VEKTLKIVEGTKFNPTKVTLTERSFEQDDDKTEIKKVVTYDQFETAGEYANRVQAATESKLKDKNGG